MDDPTCELWLATTVGCIVRCLYACGMRSIYSLLLLLIRPFVHLRLRWRARQSPAYGERIDERFGYTPANIPRGALWIHAVSAGETIAAAPLVRQLLNRLAQDKVPLLITTMTPTGSAEVKRLFGDSVFHCYAPYDFSDGVRRFLDATRPRALVIMETEIWPNMVTMTASRNIPVALVNARLSARSAKGYARVSSLLSPVLRSFHWIACQTSADADRFVALGATGAQVEVTGNIKFDLADVATTDEQHRQLNLISERANLSDRSLWIAGSTHDGEDPIILQAHRQLRKELPDACLILVPRHPERFDEVTRLAQAEFADAEQTVVRLSQWQDKGQETQTPSVIIADLMGMLRSLYTLADVAFIGGSLVDRGGHNPIEAAAAGLPMLMGSARFNFEAVCGLFAEAGCLHSVSSAEDLRLELCRLLTNRDLRVQQGARAAELVAANTGATDRLCARLTGFVRG